MTFDLLLAVCGPRRLAGDTDTAHAFGLFWSKRSTSYRSSMHANFTPNSTAPAGFEFEIFDRKRCLTSKVLNIWPRRAAEGPVNGEW